MTTPINHFENKLAFETDASDLYEALSQAENVIVIDARSPEAYAIEHIPSAINIPHRTMSAESTRELEKSGLYVTYCDGIGCNASTKGALKMAHLGFDVRELMGGIDWWRRDGYATEGTGAQPGREVVCGC